VSLRRSGRVSCQIRHQTTITRVSRTPPSSVHFALIHVSKPSLLVPAPAATQAMMMMQAVARPVRLASGRRPQTSRQHLAKCCVAATGKHTTFRQKLPPLTEVSNTRPRATPAHMCSCVGRAPGAAATAGHAAATPASTTELPDCTPNATQACGAQLRAAAGTMVAQAMHTKQQPAPRGSHRGAQLPRGLVAGGHSAQSCPVLAPTHHRKLICDGI
jgi:hypothetical protein